MRIKYFIYVFVIAIIAIAAHLKDKQNLDLNLLANIEAFSATYDHGEFDPTLEPYRQLSSYDYWVGEFGRPTKIPCCKDVDSQFSGCAKGLNDCP